MAADHKYDGSAHQERHATGTSSVSERIEAHAIPANTPHLVDLNARAVPMHADAPKAAGEIVMSSGSSME